MRQYQSDNAPRTQFSRDPVLRGPRQQLRSELAGLPLSEQLDRVRPPSPMRADAPVQMARDPEVGEAVQFARETRRAGTLRPIQKATPVAKILADSFEIPNAQVRDVERAQNFMNDLYKKDASHGDGSTAFIAMAEAKKGGPGKDPVAIEGGTLHATKCREAVPFLQGIVGLLPAPAQQRINQEIAKLNEAVAFVDGYRAGRTPSPPRWAARDLRGY